MSNHPLILLYTLGNPAASTARLVTRADLPKGIRGESYVGGIEGDDGEAPYTYSVTAGSLPTGLSIDVNTGEITGTTSAQGYFEFQVEALDSLGNPETVLYSIEVGGGIVIQTTLPYCEVDIPYSTDLVATGGTAPYTWTVESGSLPTGFTIVGATLAGTHASILQSTLDEFVLRCTDASGNFSIAPFGLPVWKPVSIIDDATVYSIENTFFRKQYAANWGDLTGSPLENYPLPRVQWQLEDYGIGFLPPDLVFNPADATISGIPLASSPGFFDLIVTDEMGGTYTFTVVNFIVQSIRIPALYDYLFGDGASTHFEFLSPYRSNKFLAVVVEVATGKEVECLITHLHNPPLFPDDDFINIDVEKPPGVDEYKLIVIGQ